MTYGEMAFSKAAPKAKATGEGVLNVSQIICMLV